VTTELKEQYVVKLEDLQPSHLKCTGQLSLQFEPAPSEAFDYPIQLTDVSHLSQLCCNPQFVQDHGENKYQVHVDSGTSELVAVMYTVHPSIVSRFLPIKAKCIWDFQLQFAKIVIHMKLNPTIQIPLKNVVYEVQLPETEIELVQNTPDSVPCEIVDSILRWSFPEDMVPTEDSISLSAVLRSPNEQLKATPVSLKFEASGHFGEKEIQVAVTETNEKYILGDIKRTSVVETFQID